MQQQLFVDLGGYADSQDKVKRHQAVATAVARIPGATMAGGPDWRGYYFASGGAKVIRRLLAAGDPPEAIICPNDQAALGVMAALREHGIDVPGQVAVTGIDDLPMTRHLRTSLTTVRQPIREPTTLVRRESCGCAPGETARRER